MKVLAKVGLILLVWVIIPSALGFAGYYFVGPNLGKNGWFGNVAQKIAPPAKVVTETKPDETKATEVEVDEPSTSKFTEPEVEVTVSKGETRRSSRDEEPVRPRKRKPKPAAPKPEEPPSSTDPASDAPTRTGGEPPVDDGGSGGAAGDGR